MATPLNKIALAFICLLGLSACKDEVSVPVETTGPREVFLVAVAPDGTNLWKTKVNGYSVFFSSSGTNYTIHEGKTTRDIQVPNQ